MFTLPVVAALLGLTSDVSARRLANKGQRDLSVERWGQLGQMFGMGSETSSTTTTTSSAQVATTETTKIADAEESIDTTVATSDSVTKPVTTAAPVESTEVPETADAEEFFDANEALDTTIAAGDSSTKPATTPPPVESTEIPETTVLDEFFDAEESPETDSTQTTSSTIAKTTATTTTTTWVLEDLDDLPDCLSIPTYPGKCSISQHPGACYSLDEDDIWQCWSDSQPKETMTKTTCTETVGKQGACIFKDHFAKPSIDDLKLCSDVPGFNSQCHPNTEMWGACYSSDLNAWRCIRKDEPADVISHYREGDCKVTPTADDQTVAHDDVCLIPSVENTVYKCSTVPTYKAEVPASSCLQEGISFACFSLREDVTWQCLPSSESVPSCMSAPIPDNEKLVDGEGETYYGVCVHERSPYFESASSAHDLGTPGTTTTTTTTTTPTTTKTTVTPTTAKTTTAETAKMAGVDSSTKPSTSQTPGETTTTTKSGTIKAQANGVTIMVLLLASKALLM